MMGLHVVVTIVVVVVGMGRADEDPTVGVVAEAVGAIMALIRSINPSMTMVGMMEGMTTSKDQVE